jgi:hypothetical protein
VRKKEGKKERKKEVWGGGSGCADCSRAFSKNKADVFPAHILQVLQLAQLGDVAALDFSLVELLGHLLNFCLIAAPARSLVAVL